MKIHSLEREAALGSLVTKETGLSGDEAGRRLSEFGPNEIKEAKKKAAAEAALNAAAEKQAAAEAGSEG